MESSRPPTFYIPYVSHSNNQYYIKGVLDTFKWGSISSIELKQKEKGNSAIITFHAWTPALKEISKILEYNHQLKIQHTPYTFWWFKRHIQPSKDVPKILVHCEMPLVINLNSDSDSESEYETETETE